MAILSSVDIGEGIVDVVVSHDPTSVATDALKGSRITEQSTGFIFIKTDDGATTNVKKLFSQAGDIFAGADETTLSAVKNLKVSLAETVDPVTTNDVNEGYSVGSRWINISTAKAFVCLDNTVSAAVWKEITTVGAGGWADDGTVVRLETATDSVGIGTAAPDASSVLDITSTTKGVLPPRMTTAQIDAISSPAIGLVAFDTDKNLLRVRKTSEWCHIPCGVVTGQFSHGVSQKPSVTTPVSLLFDMNDITLEGITHSTTVKSEEFTATIAKSYTFMLAPQWERTTAGAGPVRTIDFFVQKSTDGGTVFTDIPNSNVKIKAGSEESKVIPLMITVAMNIDDIVRFQMRVSTTGDGLGTVFAAAETGPPTIPATPSQLLTIFSGD